ncbi:putative ribonuclease H-like domain-containing protein, partial [Tanacetum coccineum]
VYVDDIIFGSTNKELCIGFKKLMKDKFQMSSMGELTFFLGLQVTQKADGIFINQDKYVAEILKKFNYTDCKKQTVVATSTTEAKYVAAASCCGKILKKFNYTDVKSASTLVDLEKPLVKDGDADDVDGFSFELVAYIDSDYDGATQDRESTTGGCQFLGNMLISWQCKKQTVVAISTTKAEYVAIANLFTKGFDAGRYVKRGQDTKIPQSSGPSIKVGDEAVHKELGDIMERAATTTSSFEAEQDNGNIK